LISISEIDWSKRVSAQFALKRRQFMSGITATIWSIALLVAFGSLVLIGARYARHRGRLQSHFGKMMAVLVIGLLAVAIWVGPAMFLATDGVGQ
jgi:predicted RND superfamily exporter protein